jgi:Uma2 family endonuclease
MSAEEFVEWATLQPEGTRYELEAGQVVSMASERLLHALTKLKVARRLEDAVARAGLACDVLPDGMAVRVDADTVYEPDAQVRCGPPLPDDAILVTDPVVVVEVRSPSTGGRDAHAKMDGYFRLPSVRHYLVVIADAQTIIHHARGEGGRIATAIVRDGPVALDPPVMVLDGVWPIRPASDGSTPA